ncbi:MAG: RNA polymerase sigma-70 factor [Actinomycetota bacterium]|nr:RNA polymerase sigma-70 factor [Actinomycetota bacterium]
MTEVFEEHRRTLFGIAYRMLGSVADAEDVVQEAWLRWNGARDDVDNPRAYLARTVTNLALNHLSSATVRRERYVGPWLPEPLVTEPDATEDVERAESVSLAMLVVMETLSPLERAVFVLKEVFGFPYAEIAQVLERSEASVRQVGHRARSHVQARRPRYAAPDEVRDVTERFLAACLGGDLNQMLELLAPDVTAWTDGGGKVRAALRPLHGADNVARWLLGVIARQVEATEAEGGIDVRFADVNGQPGAVIVINGQPDTVASADVADGRITAMRLVRNPDKLRGVALRPPDRAS